MNLWGRPAVPLRVGDWSKKPNIRKPEASAEIDGFCRPASLPFLRIPAVSLDVAPQK